MDCSICYEAITKETGKLVMSCEHTFHYRCITSWFYTKTTDGGSCPLCRHEATHYEQLPGDASLSETEPISTEALNEMAEAERLAGYSHQRRMAARTHFQRLEEPMRNTLAALIIQKIYRGHICRKNVKNLRTALHFVHSSEFELRTTMNQLRAAIIRKKFATIRLQQGFQTLVVHATTKIQRCWKEFIKTKRMNELARFKIGSLIITWKRTGLTSWERIVYNPEESEPQMWNGEYYELPPQRLVYETSLVATKIQAIWRGFITRKSLNTV